MNNADLTNAIAEAKRKLPLPALLRHYRIDGDAVKGINSPFRPDSDSGAFGIFHKKDGAWNWKDLVTGDFGDEIDFIEKYENRSKEDSVIKFLEMAEVPHPAKKTSAPISRRVSAPAAPAEARPQKSAPAPAPFDWQKCVEAAKSKLAQVADWRGISPEFLEALRGEGLIGLFQPWLQGANPAVAFPVHDADGKVIGCHYRLDAHNAALFTESQKRRGKDWTYKEGDWMYSKGAKTAPLLIGDPKAAADIFIFESQWDALAVADKLGRHEWHEEGRRNVAFVVTRGSGNGALVEGLLNPDARVTVWPQNDKPGKDGTIPAEAWFAAVTEASKGLTLHRVEIPKEHKDANDWIRAGADKAVLQEAIVAAKKARKSRLSIRTVREILNMEFDDSDNYFGDRIMAQGQALALLGPGGVGKSRLVLQLALCMITGRDFLDMPTHAKGKKWLFLQTENSNRRLNKDLRAMISHLHCTPDELDLVDSCLFIHTVENLYDAFLDFGNSEDAAHMQYLVEEILPDILVADPLNTFTSEDLNSDKDMRAVVTAVSRLAKTRNPDAVPLVLHHAITGKAGAAKAVGWDKASYGRNSKALFAWARAQVNVAPRDPEDETKILISCGKNNNGTPFPEIGVFFDKQSGLYAVDPDYDPEAFRESVGLKSGQKTKILIPADEVAKLFDDEITRKDLVGKIMARWSCGERRAYYAVDDARRIKAIIVKRNSPKKNEIYQKPSLQTSFPDVEK